MCVCVAKCAHVRSRSRCAIPVAVLLRCVFVVSSLERLESKYVLCRLCAICFGGGHEHHLTTCDRKHVTHNTLA